jgi:hypothetical protein
LHFVDIKSYPDNSVLEKHKELLNELEFIFNSIDAKELFIKQCKEKNRLDKFLFCPKSCNKLCKKMLREKNWKSYKHKFKYKSGNFKHGSYEVDFLKNRLAVELQFGKYAFMPDNVMKFEIFHKHLKLIDVGILIVPSKHLQFNMSSGPGCFQQIIQRLDDLNYQNPLIVIGLGG